MYYYFQVALCDVVLINKLHYLMFLYVVWYFFNLRLFDHALVAAALTLVTLVIIARFDVAVF